MPGARFRVGLAIGEAVMTVKDYCSLAAGLGREMALSVFVAGWAFGHSVSGLWLGFAGLSPRASERH